MAKKKLSMAKKILIANAIYFAGMIVGVILMIIFNYVINTPKIVGVLAFLLVAGGSCITGHFLSRCPYCHKSLHWTLDGCLFEYCPYCGKHF